MKTVIMAGGKGTRIASIAGNLPKPMIPICGKPVLQHEIECLRDQGFCDIIITVNYLANVIIDYFGDGHKYGVNIEYYIEKEPLGNAGALLKIKDKLTDDFLLLNADSLFDIDFNRFINYHKKKDGLVTLFAHPNSHPFDSGLLICDENKSVMAFLSKEDDRPKWYKNRVNAGLHVIKKKALDSIVFNSEKIDLDRQILKPLCGSGELFAYDSPEYVKDMGTPDRYDSVVKDFENGLIWNKNLSKKQKAIFFKGNGIIKFICLSKDTNQLRLTNDFVEAIKRVNKTGYLAIILIDQTVVNEVSIPFTGPKEICNVIETLLGKEGAYVDGLYFCLCYAENQSEENKWGFQEKSGQRKNEFDILRKAATDYNIDLPKSWVISNDDYYFLPKNNVGYNYLSTGDKKDLLETISSILKK